MEPETWMDTPFPVESLDWREPASAPWSSWPLQDGDVPEEDVNAIPHQRQAILRRLVELFVCVSLRPILKTSLVARIETRLAEAGCDVTAREIREATTDPSTSRVGLDALGRYYAAQGFVDLPEAWNMMVEVEDLVELLSETGGEGEHLSTESRYLRDVGLAARLSPAEETSLARRILRGDKGARDRMIVANLRLSWYWARRYRNHGVDLLDLAQVANIGLVKAVDRFDPERGFALAPFATATIRGEISRYFRDFTWCVSVPRRLKETLGRLRTVRSNLMPTLQRPPTLDELAEAAGVTTKEAAEALAIGRACEAVSLEALQQEHEEAGAADCSHRGAEPCNACDAVDSRSRLESALATLGARERYLLHLRFWEDLTQAQIAERMDISQMHVSRLIRSSLELLRPELDEPEHAELVGRSGHD